LVAFDRSKPQASVSYLEIDTPGIMGWSVSAAFFRRVYGDACICHAHSHRGCGATVERSLGTPLAHPSTHTTAPLTIAQTAGRELKEA
jgi:hypothetical protein